MQKKLLLPEIQTYIRANLHEDLHALLLKKSPFPEVSMSQIVQQIKGRKVAEKKFGFLLRDGIIFPEGLSLEQSSSEAAARYKASLATGKTFADLTSGFGSDAFFIAEHFSETTLVEQNPGLLEIVQHNWTILGRNANFITGNAETFLKTTDRYFDCIFLDPARRDASKRKVFLLEDLSPDILTIQDLLLNKAGRVMIKLSPLIDISYLTDVLKNIEAIHIIAVKNEVKEVLVLLGNEYANEPEIVCVNLESAEPEFSFVFGDEKKASATYSAVQNYLYIPNNAILKSGSFQLTAQHFGLQKLHPNTHFYTSNEKLDKFPGRILTVEKIMPKTLVKGSKWNIISKNYPLKPEALRKKYHLNDGGNRYLIFTEDIHGKVVLTSK